MRALVRGTGKVEISPITHCSINQDVGVMSPKLARGMSELDHLLKFGVRIRRYSNLHASPFHR